MNIKQVTLNIIPNIREGIYKRANRILDRLEKSVPEGFYPRTTEVKPFYNKFLPKILRKTTKIEFHPNSSIKKSETVFNGKKQLIKTEQFDELGNSTYFETFNPITKKGVVRQFENGQKIETTFYGSIITKLKRFDESNKLIYREEFNPNTKIKKVTKFTPNMRIDEVYKNSKLTYKSERGINGDIYEEGFFPQTGLHYIQMGERIRGKDGKLSKHSKLYTLEIENPDETMIIVERKNTGNTTYYTKRVLSSTGKEIKELERNINSEQVYKILKQVKSGELNYIN